MVRFIHCSQFLILSGVVLKTSTAKYPCIVPGEPPALSPIDFPFPDPTNPLPPLDLLNPLLVTIPCDPTNLSPGLSGPIVVPNPLPDPTNPVSAPVSAPTTVKTAKGVKGAKNDKSSKAKSVKTAKGVKGAKNDKSSKAIKTPKSSKSA